MGPLNGRLMLGRLTRKERERLALSSDDAARRLGISRRHYLDIEEGKIWPNWTTYDGSRGCWAGPHTFIAEPGSLFRLDRTHSVLQGST